MPVATRRKAPVADLPPQEDPEVNLRKKPVRKPAAATSTTTSKNAKPATAKKTVSTRSKKIEVHSDAETVQEEEEDKPPAKTTRKAALSVKKDEPVKGKAPTATTTTTTTSTRSTRAGSVRGAKSQMPAGSTAPKLDPPKPAKPTRQTRTAATKAPPLSPKKVTQVSNVQTRTTRTTGKKGAAPTKSTTRAKGTSRRRAVSDENADVHGLSAKENEEPEEPEEEEEEDDEITVTTATPSRKTPLKGRLRSRTEPEESEASMSSRPTTPGGSPAPAASEVDDEAEQEEKEEVEEDDNDDDGEDDDSVAESNPRMQDDDDSEDELNAPKTPLKRCSPGTEARYHASVRNTIRRLDDHSRSPVRRQGRSQNLASSTKKTLRIREEPGIMESVHQSVGEAFDEEPSFIPDEGILEVDDEAQVDDDTLRPAFNQQLPSPAVSAEEVDSEATTISLDQGDTAEEDVAHEDVEDKEDGEDETVVIHQPEEYENVAPEEMQEDDQSEVEDSMIIDQPPAVGEQDEDEEETDANSEDESMAAEYDDDFSDPPEPETMMWENIRQDQTITLNFDMDLSNVRAPLPQPDPTERLDLAGLLMEQQPDEDEQKSTAETPDLQPKEGDRGSVVETPAHQPEVASETSNRRETVNFGDFLDDAILSEPTRALDDVFDELNEPSTVDNVQEREESLDTSTSTSADSQETVIANTSSASQDSMMVDASTESQDSMLANASEATPEITPEPTSEEPHTAETPKAQLQSPGRTYEEEVLMEVDVPHYALSTLAFDARRKSLPAFNVQTPVKPGIRPNTSDGASIQRVVNPFTAWPISRRQSCVAVSAQGTPVHSRPSTALEHRSPYKGTSPLRPSSRANIAATTPLGTPQERRPRFAFPAGHAQTVAGHSRFRSPVHSDVNRRLTFHRMAVPNSPPKNSSAVAVETPVNSPAASAAATPGERRPKLAPRETYEEHVAAPPAVATPNERRPRFAPRETYEEHAMTVAAPKRFSTPVKAQAKRRETVHRLVHAEPKRTSPREPAEASETPISNAPAASNASPASKPSPSPIAPAVATPRERFPRLRPREDYEEHAKTVAAPVRFATPPSKSPTKRPATAQKNDTLRKTAALRASASRDSHTPIKTPLKPGATAATGAATPAQEPLTPHPAAPLRGIVALVEVFTLEGASASAPFIALLHRLGAKTSRSWNDRVTHVVFKDGSPTTLQRVRLHNKDVEENKTGAYIHCINSRWVSDCEYEGMRKDEGDEAYIVDVHDVPRGGKRRRKSMEPSALMNVNGNVVRDRSSSWGRSSLSRASMKFESPAKRASETPPASATAAPTATGDNDAAAMETPKTMSTADEVGGEESPVTPAWIAAPEQLVQQTAPMNRVRKLQLQGTAEEKNRRLTFWNGTSA